MIRESPLNLIYRPNNMDKFIPSTYGHSLDPSAIFQHRIPNNPLDICPPDLPVRLQENSVADRGRLAGMIIKQKEFILDRIP